MDIQGGWKLVCIILALVMFGLATALGPWGANPPAWPYWNRLVSGGLFFYVLSILVK
jgi:hypothetical protein